MGTFGRLQRLSFSCFCISVGTQKRVVYSLHHTGGTGKKMVTEYLRRYRMTRLSHLLSIGIVAVFISIALVACGSSTGSGGSATPTATAQAQNCGTIATNPRGAPTDLTVALKDEQCFSQAYQQCHNATLVYTLHGVDTTAVHTFTIENHNGQCVILDAMQHSIAPAPLSPATTYQCSGVALQSDGLHITGCGQDGNNGTIVVPSINSTVQ
jgi:hypothetical protein